MSRAWKISIAVVIVALVVLTIYVSIPRDREEPIPETTAVAETNPSQEPNMDREPAIGPLPRPGEEEVPYIHGASGELPTPVTRPGGSEIIRRDTPGYIEESLGSGMDLRRAERIDEMLGETGEYEPDSSSFKSSAIQEFAGLSDIRDSMEIPATGPSASGVVHLQGEKHLLAMDPLDPSSMDFPFGTEPPVGIPLPPSGPTLPSLDEPIPDAEGPPQRIGKRFILPPIFGNDLLRTVIGERKFTLVYADSIDSDKQEGITKLHGNVRVQYKDNIIESQEAIFHKEEEWARFFGEGGIFAKNDDGELRCDELEAHFDTKIAYLTGPVDIIRYANTEEELIPLSDNPTRREKFDRALKKKETHITCYDAEYDWGEKIVDLHNSVRIEQEDKYIECEELHSESKSEKGLLTGDVVLHQDNGQWLFDENVVTDEDKKVTQVLAKEKTTVYCEELEYNSQDNWYQLREDVRGLQPDKEGECDIATLDDSEDVHLLTLDGDVRLHQENGDWLFEGEIVTEDESDEVKDDMRKWATLTCDILDVHTDTEDAEAKGDVYIEQEHQNGKADEAFYLRKHDMIHLTGNVEVNREEKHTVFAEEAFLFMTTRIFEARGDVRSTVWLDVDEEQAMRDDENESQ